MALNLEQKKAVVAEVAEVAKSAHSAVAAEYRGLTVSEMTELRRKARAEWCLSEGGQEHAGAPCR
jgi:large subunit ribosomal protein L10